MISYGYFYLPQVAEANTPQTQDAPGECLL